MDQTEMDLNENSNVVKLLEFAKKKPLPIITWDEITDLLGQDFVNSPEMESVLKLLNEKKIQLIETDIIGEDEDQEPDVDLDDDDESEDDEEDEDKEEEELLYEE